MTFDEARSAPRPCPCNRHLITGAWSRLYCPFASQRRAGRWGIYWSSPDLEMCE